MFDGLLPGAHLVYVGPTEWPRFADRVRPQIEKMAAGSRGCFDAASIEDSLARGAMQLWVIYDGADIVCVFLSEIVQYPLRRAFRLVGVVGVKPRRWTHLLAEVEQVARSCFGCDLMQALHAPGHERLLRTKGWKVFHFLSEKDL